MKIFVRGWKSLCYTGYLFLEESNRVEGIGKMVKGRIEARLKPSFQVSATSDEVVGFLWNNNFLDPNFTYYL